PVEVALVRRFWHLRVERGAATIEVTRFHCGRVADVARDATLGSDLVETVAAGHPLAPPLRVIDVAVFGLHVTGADEAAFVQVIVAGPDAVGGARCLAEAGEINVEEDAGRGSVNIATPLHPRAALFVQVAGDVTRAQVYLIGAFNALGQGKLPLAVA